MVTELHQFVEHLTTSGIMLPEASTDAVSQFKAANGSEDAATFANFLVSRDILTPYQANAILNSQAEELVFGDYVVLDELGQGGMGIVYKALHRYMQRVVAIKILSSDIVDRTESYDRFEREIHAAARVTHPNIVACYDAGEHAETRYLVMELVDGEDLANVVRREGPLPIDLAVNEIKQAAQGLDHVHRRGIIHRDVKPSNLMRSNEGTIKVLDFGLASLRNIGQGASAEDQLTGFGQLMGTYNYMSPEQASCSRSADARSDIYSLGCTLYYLVSGRAPFKAESIVDSLLAHRESPAPELVSPCEPVPQHLDNLVRSMLAKEPDDRPQSMTEVIQRLEAIQAAREFNGSAITQDWLPGSLPGTLEDEEESNSELPTGRLRTAPLTREGLKVRPWKTALAAVTIVVSLFLLSRLATVDRPLQLDESEAATGSDAAEESTTEEIVFLATPPAESGLNSYPESDTSIFVLNEGTRSVSNLPIDFKVGDAAATIDSFDVLQSRMISGEFESWLLRFDPVGNPYTSVSTKGTIRFETEIEALILRGITVRDTHIVLGAPETRYETTTSYFRGLELGKPSASDKVRVLEDRRTLEVELNAGAGPAGVDQLRVLVAVPESKSENPFEIGGE